jgi:hypothetical protein
MRIFNKPLTEKVFLEAWLHWYKKATDPVECAKGSDWTDCSFCQFTSKVGVDYNCSRCPAKGLWREETCCSSRGEYTVWKNNRTNVACNLNAAREMLTVIEKAYLRWKENPMESTSKEFTVFDKSGKIWTNYPYALWILYSLVKLPWWLISKLIPYWFIATIFETVLLTFEKKDGQAESSIKDLWHNRNVKTNMWTQLGVSFYSYVITLMIVSGLSINWDAKSTTIPTNMCLDWCWLVPFAVCGAILALSLVAGFFYLLESD